MALLQSDQQRMIMTISCKNKQ